MNKKVTSNHTRNILFFWYMVTKSVGQESEGKRFQVYGEDTLQAYSWSKLGFIYLFYSGQDLQNSLLEFEGLFVTMKQTKI